MQSRGIVIVAGGSYKPILRLQFDRDFRYQALLYVGKIRLTGPDDLCVSRDDAFRI